MRNQDTHASGSRSYVITIDSGRNLTKTCLYRWVGVGGVITLLLHSRCTY